MSQGPMASRRYAPAWPKDVLRITFGVIWLIDAMLKWLPGFRASYMSVIMAEAQGQPGWLEPWFHFWIRVQHPDAMFLAYLAAVIETLIALALIAGFALSWWWRIAEMRRPAPVEAPAPTGVDPAGEAATPQPQTALSRSA